MPTLRRIPYDTRIAIAHHGINGWYLNFRDSTSEHKIGMETTSNGFNVNAPQTSPCKRWCVARSEPHPGQYKPLRARKGHGRKKPDRAGSTKYKSTAQLKTAAVIARMRTLTNVTRFLPSMVAGSARKHAKEYCERYVQDCDRQS